MGKLTKEGVLDHITDNGVLARMAECILNGGRVEITRTNDDGVVVKSTNPSKVYYRFKGMPGVLNKH